MTFLVKVRVGFGRWLIFIGDNKLFIALYDGLLCYFLPIIGREDRYIL